MATVIECLWGETNGYADCGWAERSMASPYSDHGRFCTVHLDALEDMGPEAAQEQADNLDLATFGDHYGTYRASLIAKLRYRYEFILSSSTGSNSRRVPTSDDQEDPWDS